ncbi:MAG: hypothetical protein K2N13_03040 [Paraprevotella sp.]|nr:hypothetical protein [Paraprevotella sp.]
MPIWRITVTVTRCSKGQRIDKGLSVDIQTFSHANPIYNAADAVANAFLAKGVDIKRMNALNSSCLKAVKIG